MIKIKKWAPYEKKFSGIKFNTGTRELICKTKDENSLVISLAYDRFNLLNYRFGFDRNKQDLIESFEYAQGLFHFDTPQELFLWLSECEDTKNDELQVGFVDGRGRKGFVTIDSFDSGRNCWIGNAIDGINDNKVEFTYHAEDIIKVCDSSRLARCDFVFKTFSDVQELFKWLAER